MAALILVTSTGLFFFYCQAAVQKVLRRAFMHSYFQSIVTANGLDFPSLRRAFEESDGATEYAQLLTKLKCDFEALKYLLKHACNTRQTYAREELFLMLYFRVILVSLAVRHLLRLAEKPAVLELTKILQYFANVVGERKDSVRYNNPYALEYIPIPDR